MKAKKILFLDAFCLICSVYSLRTLFRWLPLFGVIFVMLLLMMQMETKVRMYGGYPHAKYFDENHICPKLSFTELQPKIFL